MVRKKRNPFRRIEPVLQHEGFVYTFAFVYLLVNALYFFRGAAPEWRLGHESHDGLFIRFVRATARGSGSILNVNSGLVILVASKLFMGFLRMTPLNMVVPFDKAMPTFHALVGSTIAVASLVHTICHLINYGVNDPHTKELHHWHVALAITGAILFISILLIRLTTTDTIRGYILYETWYKCHIGGMVTYFIVLIIHGSHHAKFSSHKFIVGPLILYFLDTILRRMRNMGRYVVVPGYSSKAVSPSIVKLRMKKKEGVKYMAGQYCYINIPKISKYQWHPFSLASSPHEPYLTFYVEVAGDWTKELFKLCLPDAETIPAPANIILFVRGPFGCPSQHTSQYEHVILISSGVGATPFTSITKHVHNYIMHDQDKNEHHGVLPKPPKFTHGFHFAEQARRRSKLGRESDASSGASSNKLDLKFFERIGGAANRTFLEFGQTLRNAIHPEDDDASTPWHSEDERVSEKSKTLSDKRIELEGQKYGRKVEARGGGASSSFIQADPYTNVGVDESSEEKDLVIDELETVDWKDRAGIILHSVTMNWFLLWLMFLRFSVIIFGRITGYFEIKQRGLCVYAHPALNWIDLTLSSFLLIAVAATLLIEITSDGLKKFFYTAFGNIFDFFILIPLAFSCVLLQILGFLNFGENSYHVTAVVVFGVWPVLSVFLLWRIIRTIGPRVALAQFLRVKLARTKSLDYLVINRFPRDDSWIIDELLPIASSGPIRIHRFLTGEKVRKVVDKRMEKYIVPPIKTTYTYPDWNKVFLSVVENAPSGSVIGVFFCGSPKVLRIVQEAVMNAVHTSIKNGFERNYDPAAKIGGGNGTEKAAFGCNIRISVRAEVGSVVGSRQPKLVSQARPPAVVKDGSQ